MIIAGTGHRPKYFPTGYDLESDWVKDIKLNLKISLALIAPKAVISGLALGWDMFLAETAIDLNIPVHGYIPFADQGANWPEEQRAKYDVIMEALDSLYLCSKGYHPKCFFKRDYLMVDHCDEVYALWNPEAKSGGTYQTIKYARAKNKPIKNFWVDE